MTDSSCEDVRRKLVDSPAGDSLGELLKHVESCERCRERLRGAMRDAGSAARDDAALAPELPKEDGDAKAPPRDWAPPDRGSRKGRAVPWVAALLSLALVGWMLAGTCGGMRSSSNELRSVNSWSGVVEAVSSTEDVGAAAEICRSGVCSAAAVGTRVEAGDTLRSGPAGRARLKLEDGTIVALERATTVVVDADEDAARLERGVLVVDSLVKLEAFTKRATSLRLDLPKGRASLASGKLAARVIGPTTTLEVLRGAAEVEGIAGAGRNVRVGQVVTWLGDGSPKVTHAGVAAPGLVMASIDEAAASGSRGLGELRAKKPGTDEERAGVVTLRRHAAKVRVVDGFARVEIDETFQNDGDEVLEGIYRFPLPPDAQIERLALEVDGKLEDGAFVDRDRAAAIWRGAIVNAGGRVKPREEIVWVPGPWKDPALLEWQRGGRFELRIFPIPRHGSRRVVLAYTLALPSVAGVRRVAVPLPHAARRDLRLDELSVDLEVRGHDPSLGLNVHGYDVVRASRGDVDALTFDRRGFVPSGDLTVEFASRARDHAVTAWAYALSSVNDVRSSGSAAGEATSATPFDARGNYLALALRPEWPSSADEAPRALALVVDASRSMLGENHRRAADLATQIVRELDVRDRFTVLACDVTCRSLGAPRHPDSTSESAIREFLRASPPAGASDVAAAVVEGARAVAGVPGFTGKVFFLGDGTPTVGPLRPATLAAALRDGVPSGVTVSGVAIGAEADRESLGALARAGRGVVIGYEPGRGSDEVAVAVLAAAGGGELTDVNVELPEGLVDAAPRELGTISPGAELLVAARMVQPTVSGIVRLSGRVGGVPFEQRYPIDVEARSDAGNAFVPRVYAGLRIRDLERRGTAEARGQAVALSSRFDVASRYTSLLVLESPAMFRAFGLDNRRLAPDWTGEVDALGSTRGSAAEEEARRNEAAQGPTLAEPEAGGDAYLDAPAPAATFGAPAAAAPRPATAPSASDGANAKKSAARAETVDDGGFAEPPLDAADPGRPVRRRRPPMPIATQPSFENLVPMKVVWEREVAFVPGTQGERDASGLAALEDELARDPNRREVVKKLVARYLRSGNLERAETLVGRWLDKEPLDDEGLLARAEITAARGNREAALRDLQSVIEARPGDGDRILGLARALQLVGDSVGACRHLVAAAELRHKDAGVLGDAVRCVREGGSSSLATALLDGVDDDLRRRVSDAPVTTFPPATGELRLDATWTGDGELDLVLVDPDGRGISWLDAPGKLIVRAADVASTTRETLALTGAKAGEYALQVRRARGRGVLRGEVAIAGPNGLSRRVPFTLEADAASLGTLQFRWRRKLVPVDALRPRPVW